RVGQRGQLNLLADYGFLHAHEQTERLVAEQGLEVANPLGDPDIVQFAFATPEYVRRCGRVGRACHRAALKGILPDLVAERMDKAEFNSTFLYHLPRMADLLMREIPARHPDWVSGKGMAELFAMITKPENSEDPGWTLWALVGCDKVYDRYQ
ncbi:MAG TPA: asparagine synthase-related protein, partial [Candidatus Acidoferrum sp.]|nr:asparagine synthase-related protein [Candidatus Acidoferrum sp.]